MAALPLPDNLARDATWLIQAIDPRARLARLVRMDSEAYRVASFLDDRMLTQRAESRLCDLDEVVAVAAGLAELPAGWIFHIGHVGSTLVSRLLGELEGLLSLREPRSLRDLAVAGDERPRLARALGALMGRRFANDRIVIIKATSFVSEYAPLLVAPWAPALFLYASPSNYIASILAGENSVKELAALHEVRIDRLRSRGIELVGYDRSDAHRAAAAWACEMTSLESAAVAMGEGRVLWGDFDAMLRDMSQWLERCAAQFGFAVGRDRIDQLVAGPLMRRYSKALEYDYSPSLRAELLNEAAALHRTDIADALTALRRDAAAIPMLARALGRAERES